MKKHSVKLLKAIFMCLLLLPLFASCVGDDDYWPYSPPPGWGSNYFYDSRLVGDWQLTQANSYPVSAADVNYMEFYGGGRGRYYYYSYGRPLSEQMAYFCQKSGAATTNYQINVQYQDGEASTMAYWFTDGGNTLWFQWKDSYTGSVTTYVYSRVYSIP